MQTGILNNFLTFDKKVLRKPFTGFTLIEVLIVLVIIGIIAGTVSLSLIRRPTHFSNADFLNLLKNKILLAQQDSILMNKTLGLALSEEQYQFMDYEDGQWKPSRQLGLEKKNWPSEWKIQLSIHESLYTPLPQNEPSLPQIIFSASGSITFFKLCIDNRYTLTHDFENTLAIQTI